MVALDGLGLALAFSSSAADACHEATQKALASYLPHPELALALKSGIIAVVFIGNYFQQENEAWARLVGTFRNPNFSLAWAVSEAINVGANFLMILGMKRGKMSDTVPYLSLSPVFLLPSGYFILGELADGRGIAGVVVIAAGGFWLSRAGAADEATFDTRDAQLRQKGFLAALPPGSGIYMCIAMIHSISSAFDKRGVRAAAAPVLYGATISATVTMFALLKFAWQQHTDIEAHAVEVAPKVASAAPAAKSSPTEPSKKEPNERPSKVFRRRSSGYLADLMVPDTWEKLPDTDPPPASEALGNLSGAGSELHASPGKGSKMLRRSSSIVGSDVWQTDTDDLKRSTSVKSTMSLVRRQSSIFMAPHMEIQAPGTGKEIEVRGSTTSFATRWGLMLLSCALKMTGYWCQLKANERIYSSHLSAIRKSGVLLVLLLGKVLFAEEIGNKLMPVSTMLAGVAILAMK